MNEEDDDEPRRANGPKVISRWNLKRAVVAARADHVDEDVADRPRTRGDCANGVRPCPWVGCRFHLYLTVNPETGAITLNFPDLEPDELAETCALDVADRGGLTLEEVGAYVNLTRERVRQLEVKGLRLIREDPRLGLIDPAT